MITCKACLQKCHREHSREHVLPCFLLQITNLEVPQDLIIPEEFFRKYFLDCHKLLTLVGPSGDTWRIAHQRNGRLSGADWAKFAEQNGLLNQKALIVLFELVGVSSFYVQIMGRNGCEVIPDCPSHDQEPILHPKAENYDELKEELSISSDFEKLRHRDGLNLEHAWAHNHQHASSKANLEYTTDFKAHAWAHNHPHASSKANLEYTTETFKAHAWAHNHPHASSNANLEYTTETFKAREVLPVFCKGGRRNCIAERERIRKLTNSMTISGPSAIVFLSKSTYTLKISKDVAIRFLPQYDKKAIFIDSLGEKWQIQWRWKINAFSSGWKKFYDHHHLSVNHACMVELVEAESLTLKVTIFNPETKPEAHVKKKESQGIVCPKDESNFDSSNISLLKKWIKSFPSHIFKWSNKWSIMLKDSVLMLE